MQVENVKGLICLNITQEDVGHKNNSICTTCGQLIAILKIMKFYLSQENHH